MAQGRKYDVIAFDAMGDVITTVVEDTVKDATGISRSWLRFDNVASVRVLRTVNGKMSLYKVFVNNNGKHCEIDSNGTVRAIRI